MSGMTATARTVPSVTLPHDLLRVGDLSADSLRSLLEQAAAMKGDRRGWADAHLGHAVACVFDHPSAHARISAEAAVHRLGMLPVSFGSDDLELGHREPLEDTARVLA